MIDLPALASLHAEHVASLSSAYGRVLAELGLDAVVLHAGVPKRRSSFDDQDWPLRPTPHFMHWLALPEPEAVVVVRPGVRPKVVRLSQSTFWEAPVVPLGDFFWGALDVELAANHVAMRLAMPTGRVAFVGEDASAGERLGLPREMCNPQPLLDRLDALRTRKSAYERACLAEANRIAALGHDVVRGAFEVSDPSELELHLLFLRATSQDDPETPYKNIVAMDAHAATLHHVGYQKTRAGAQTLLVDAGASFLGYASDITRTWVKPRGEAARVFSGLTDRLEAMQKGLVAATREGMRYEALHDRAHRDLSELLADAGLVRLSPDAIDGEGISRAFFPHGLGHSLGLQCHDVGCAVTKPRADNPFLRNTSVIERGQVFTIEPGLYFIEALLAPLRHGELSGWIDWSLVDALAPLGGIRIEDDLWVGDGAIENLTRAHLPVGGGSVG